MNNYPEITEGIKENPLGYKGYMDLAGCYESQGRYSQAYLCYENALFFCSDNETDKTALEIKVNDYNKKGLSVAKTAIVILSWNQLEITKNCLESIRNNIPETARRIIVVDNASVDGSAEFLQQQLDITLLLNEENEGFPKGCNQGIALADPEDDILLLNNDTIVMPNTLFWLRMAIYERDDIGSAGSVSNNAWRQWVGEKEADASYYYNFSLKNNVPKDDWLEYRVWLVGFCLLLKRRALDKIGNLDERFSPGNHEDEDLCLRMLLQGYLNVLVKNSYIVHLGHASFGKTADYNSTMVRNLFKIREKYGFNVDEYYYPNSQLCDCLKDMKEASDVLEINCGIGQDLLYLKSMYPRSRFFGVDRMIESADFRNATSKTIELFSYVDISKANLKNRKFDYVIFNRRTGQKEELQEYIEKIKSLLKPSGKLVCQEDSLQSYKRWDMIRLDGETIMIPEENEPSLGFLEAYCKCFLKQPLPERNKGLYYIFLSIPKLWEIRADGINGAIYNNGKKEAEILFHEPIINRLVRKVDWMSDTGTVYKSDFYSSYGIRFCSVFFGTTSEPEHACFYGNDGEEVFVLNYSNNTLLTFEEGQIGRAFNSFSAFRNAVLCELKKQEQQIVFQES